MRGHKEIQRDEADIVNGDVDKTKGEGEVARSTGGGWKQAGSGKDSWTDEKRGADGDDIVDLLYHTARPVHNNDIRHQQSPLLNNATFRTGKELVFSKHRFHSNVYPLSKKGVKPGFSI